MFNASKVAGLKRNGWQVSPEYALVYIYRHPVDVYSSYVKVVQNTSGNSWANISVDKFCQLWKERTRFVLKYQKTNSDIHLIKYEDFVSHPEEEFKKLCSFLGEHYEEKPLQIEHNPDRWDSYEKFTRGKIAKKTKNWADFIDRETARKIETRLIEIMKLLGYESKL